jgi:hypothetical protein
MAIVRPGPVSLMAAELADMITKLNEITVWVLRLDHRFRSEHGVGPVHELATRPGG